MQSLLKLLLLLTSNLFSCSPNDKKQEPKSDTLISSADTLQKIDRGKTQIAQASPVDTDTLTIDKKAGVFYQPDSLQMERRRKEVDEADLRVGADDYI
jgi:hypothetical protein